MSVQIWPLIAAIFISFFATLLVFPGLLSLVQDCTLGSWTPIILIGIFSTLNFIGKYAALLPAKWTPKLLLLASCGRVLLVPLAVLCVSPSPSNPVMGDKVVVWAGIISLALGLSKGYFGSLSLIIMSAYVKDERHRELAGMCCVISEGHLPKIP